MKKILITGCSGYIGQHLAKWLENDYEVYGIDIVDPVDTTTFKKFFHHDIRERIDDFVFDFDDMPLEYDCIVHLAALVRVNESVEHPRKYYETNVNGTTNVLNGFNYHNFIFASTGAAEKPISPYAISKLAAEHIVREHLDDKNDYAVPYTIFRFYNVIGSCGYSPTNPDGLFFNLIKAKETGYFNLYGSDYNTPDGTPIRDYVHVLEICKAIGIAIRKPSCVPGADTQPFVENLGHGRGHSVLEMANMFKLVNNCEFHINYCSRRPGDVESSVLHDVSPYMPDLYTLSKLMRI